MTISEIPGQNEIFRGDIELSRERFRDCSNGNYITFNICPLGLTTPEQELLAKYFLSRILDTGAGGGGGGGVQVRLLHVPDPS